MGMGRSGKPWIFSTAASCEGASLPSTSAPSGAAPSGASAGPARAVVALGPQPLCPRAIRAIYGGDGAVTMLEQACAERPGTVTLRVNSANPTVTTASPDFVAAARGADGWEGQVWDSTVEVPATTLDALIAVHGLPAFAKIDVEGFEAAVLAGRTRSAPAPSFEVTAIQ